MDCHGRPACSQWSLPTLGKVDLQSRLSQFVTVHRQRSAVARPNISRLQVKAVLVEGTDNFACTIDIGLTKVCTAVRALCIEDVECVSNPENSQALLPSSEFFDFTFRGSLGRLLPCCCQIESCSWGAVFGCFLQIEDLVFRVFFSNFHLLKPIP